MTRPREVTELHSYLIRAALEVDAARGYWAGTDGSRTISVKEAFDGYWFGARSLKRVSELLANFRLRFDAYPEAPHALHHWVDMSPDTRQVICHWHLMLADPLYRSFTGDFMAQRRERGINDLHFDLVVSWIGSVAGERWAMSTRQQIAGKLLSAAVAAGLVRRRRDPREMTLPRVDDDALTYLLYLLRGVEFEGALLRNPYLSSVGLDGAPHDRLRQLPALRYTRQGDLSDFGWRYADLRTWAAATVAPESVLP